MNLSHYHRPEIISFDAGHTLLHIRSTVGEIYTEIAKPFGVNASPEHIDSRFKSLWQVHNQKRQNLRTNNEKQWWRELVQSCFEDYVFPHFDAYFEEIYTAFADPKYWKVEKETLALLSRLKNDYRLVLLSNWDERLRPLLKKLNLLPHFDKVFISCEMGLIKPQNALYQTVCRELDVPAENILHVGDSLEDDYLGPRRNQWQALHLSRDKQDGIFRIESLKEIENVLERIE